MASTRASMTDGIRNFASAEIRMIGDLLFGRR